MATANFSDAFNGCLRFFDPYKITKVAYESVGNNVFKCSYNEAGQEIRREQVHIMPFESGKYIAGIDPYEKRKDKKNKILLLCR